MTTPEAVPLPPESPADRVGLLFDTHYDRLYRLARRLSRNGDDALDLVQETFVRVAATPRAIPAGTRAEEAYLVRMLVNVRKDQWRKDGVRRRHAAASAPSGTSPGGEAGLIAHHDVWRALDMLAPRRRAVLVLHELEGLTAADIAPLLGVATVTVRWHLFRGRRELATALHAKGRTR